MRVRVSPRLVRCLGLAFVALALGCGGQAGQSAVTTDAGHDAITVQPASGPCNLAARYAGPLCGPDTACTLLANDVVAASSWTQSHAEFLDFGTGDAPSLALDPSCSPHVLTVLGWAQTMYSSRSAAGTWSAQSTSMPTYSGAFAFGADGQPFAVVSDGDFDTTLWSGAGGSWTMTDKLPGTVGMYGQGLAVDSSGALHAALWGELKSSVDTYAGSWVTQAFSPLNGAPMSVITVSTTSVAHVAYWGESPDSGVNGEDLYWWTPPRAPEVVSAGTSSPNEENIGLVTSAPDATNPDGKPHVVFEATLAGGDMAVVYATRTGPSAWTSTSIVEDTPSTSQNNCDPLTPTSPTDTCSYDYTTHQPVGIAASQGGDVRIFFATRHFAGTVGAECGSPGNPVACSSWNPPSAGSETDTVSVAWLTTAGTVQTTPIATTHQPSVATLAIDATGVMHLALYDAVTSSTGNVSTTDFSTRYLRIGSAGQ